MPSRIFKTEVSFDEGGANIHSVDTIDYQGILCLVGGWLENPAERYRIPARIVCPGNHRFQPNAEPGSGPDFSISAPISKAVYDGRASAADAMPGCVVVEQPDLRFPLPPGHQH